MLLPSHPAEAKQRSRMCGTELSVRTMQGARASGASGHSGHPNFNLDSANFAA